MIHNKEHEVFFKVNIRMSIFQPSFFDEAERLAALSELNDPLVPLKQHINFELFRAKLTAVFEKPKASVAGRKAYDVVLMFKILILQRLYRACPKFGYFV